MKRQLGTHIAWAAALVVALKAFVPVGFMPSVEALTDGRIELVICTGEGYQTIAVDAARFGVPQSDHAPDSSLDCPYDGTFSKVLMAPGELQAAVAISWVFTSGQPGVDAPQAAADRFLPLGSRAPPAFLG